MKSLHIFILLGLFSAATFAQTVTLPPYYGVQRKIYKSCGTATDADGNVYNTIVIGSQCWLKENLRSTKYNDGTNIPNVTDSSSWANLTSPAYCWYNNDYAMYGSVYGALYNWYTVDTEKLCPAGWHVSSFDDWSSLESYCQTITFDYANIIKEIGTTHWASPNYSNNETGFTAFAGGERFPGGEFGNNISSGFWWTNEPYPTVPTNVWYIALKYHWDSPQYYYCTKNYGFSVRCVKD